MLKFLEPILSVCFGGVGELGVVDTCCVHGAELLSFPGMKFYLLHNGTSSPECGKNALTACRTFPQLLTAFHSGRTNLPKLNVISDMSVHVDKNVLVRTDLQIRGATSRFRAIFATVQFHCGINNH